MLECIISENILGQVSVQLEMTSHDWSKLKTSGAWSQMEQILMESETQSSRCFHHIQTNKPEETYCASCRKKRFFHRFSGLKKQR